MFTEYKLGKCSSKCCRLVKEILMFWICWFSFLCLTSLNGIDESEKRKEEGPQSNNILFFLVSKTTSGFSSLIFIDMIKTKSLAHYPVNVPSLILVPFKQAYCILLLLLLVGGGAGVGGGEREDVYCLS